MSDQVITLVLRLLSDVATIVSAWRADPIRTEEVLEAGEWHDGHVRREIESIAKFGSAPAPDPLEVIRHRVQELRLDTAALGDTPDNKRARMLLTTIKTSTEELDRIRSK